MSNKICGVYKITNIVNGKFYIGSSKDIKTRWYQHKKKLNSETHGNPHLQNAWILYGSNNFIFEIIEMCSVEMQFEREQYYLNTLNPFDDNGYNLVRKISKEYMSDHCSAKECERCKKSYFTFSHRSKYCDECRKDINDGFLESKHNSAHISSQHEEEIFNAYMSRCVPGYGGSYYWNTEV